MRHNPSTSLLTLVNLYKKLRGVRSEAELNFLLLNAANAITPYRQAAFWVNGLGVKALSGTAQIDANGPYAIWLDLLIRHLVAGSELQPRVIKFEDLPSNIRDDFKTWLPAAVIFIPMLDKGVVRGATLWARDIPWREQELALLTEWSEQCAFAAAVLKSGNRPLLDLVADRIKNPFARRISSSATVEKNLYKKLKKDYILKQTSKKDWYKIGLADNSSDSTTNWENLIDLYFNVASNPSNPALTNGTANLVATIIDSVI